MRYVKAEWSAEFSGFRLAADAYLAKLPELREQLPPGAWEFASDPDHYRFSGRRCVKDLGLLAVTVPGAAGRNAAITFSPNEWKHDEGLTIEYSGALRVEVERRREIDWMETDTVVLDEILPHEGGLRHEIELADSTIVVHAADLRAAWGQPR